MGKKGQTKKPKVAGQLRYVFAANVRALVDARFKDSRNKPMDLSKAAKVSFSTAQRILSAETGPDMETVESVANAFRIDPYRLLLPEIVSPAERRAPARDNPWLTKGKPDRRRITDRRSNGSRPE